VLGRRFKNEKEGLSKIDEIDYDPSQKKETGPTIGN